MEPVICEHHLRSSNSGRLRQVLVKQRFISCEIYVFKTSKTVAGKVECFLSGNVLAGKSGTRFFLSAKQGVHLVSCINMYV